MASTVFRVHPAIGIGRVGDSEEFYLAPVNAAGTIAPHGLMGGLPVKPGTEDTPITADDFRDGGGKGNVKRQAARFRIYAYPAGKSGSYPTGAGSLVQVGAAVDGKKVADIVWTVHIANKKLNNYSTVSQGDQFRGINAYKNPSQLELRNPDYKGKQNKDDPLRLRELFIDPGPRAIRASAGPSTVIAFDAAIPASYADASGAVVPVPTYPKSFPADFNRLLEPLGPLTSLGDIRVDAGGGLIVAGGYGKAAAVSKDGINPDDPLDQATENGLWYDDAGDGPVHAVIIFDDKSTATVQPAWYVTGDPGYAPQTRNIVSIWDDVYDLWVRELALNPALFSGGQFQSGYKPSFPDDIQLIFHGAMLQRWNANLPSVAINNHDMIGAIKPTDDPTSKMPNLKTLIRNPGSDADKKTGAPMMPLSLGDAETSFLTVSATQYFLLGQWHAKVYAQGRGPPSAPAKILTGSRWRTASAAATARESSCRSRSATPISISGTGSSRIAGRSASTGQPSTTARRPRTSHSSASATFRCSPTRSSRVTSPSSCRCPGSPTTTPAPRIWRTRIRRATTRCSGLGRRSGRSRCIRSRNAITTARRGPGRWARRSIRYADPERRPPIRRNTAASRNIRTSWPTGSRSAS
jgi:hypothetical protein